MNLADELAEEEQIGGSLRDLEEALAELSEQNERLEEDCKDLEAHCRDLERLGYPSPCPVEQLLLDPPSQQSTLDAPEMRRPSAETVEVDADARVRELLQAREKSFAAMTEMQERCNHQQNEMEKLLLERSKLQADLMHSKAELQESRYLVQELQAQVEQNDLETLSHTTGDDASSNAESLHSTTSRRARKKRNIKGQGFRQAKCLDEGVELPIQANDPTEVLLRSLLSKAQANSLWYELILFLLEKAGEELPPARSESQVQKELQVMANQIKERLQQICGSDETAGVLESVLKTVGKATDQAFDSAVLYVDQKVASSPSSVVGDTVSETRSGPRESTVSETVGESQVATFKQTARDARARLQARRKQRSSVLSVTSRDA